MLDEMIASGRLVRNSKRHFQFIIVNRPSMTARELAQEMGLTTAEVLETCGFHKLCLPCLVALIEQRMPLSNGFGLLPFNIPTQMILLNDACYKAACDFLPQAVLLDRELRNKKHAKVKAHTRS